jgi:molybdopterin molybdotransferase
MDSVRNMPEFLELLPPVEALELLLKNLPEKYQKFERVSTLEALGRVVSKPVIAPEDLPAFPRSTVDGYAVRASDTFGASDTFPMYLSLVGEVPMGRAPGFKILPGQAGLIHTGGMLPDGSDAVVMLETVQNAGPGEVEVLKSVAVGENILRPGEDVRKGDKLLTAGMRLRPAEIGGLLGLGLLDVEVAVRPKVGILSSGDEVVPPQVVPAPGQVRDINSYTLSALVAEHGAEPQFYGIVPDRLQDLRVYLKKALAECDLVVITAGSSASTRDLTASVIQEIGAPGVLVHGVNVKPGKPTILAVCDGKAVIGLPGNPVSALVIAGIFVVPVIERLLGMTRDRPHSAISARLTTNLSSQAGREDWVPVRLVLTADGYLADPIFYKSNLIFSLSKADGLVHIPASANGLPVGEMVDVELLSL